MANAERVDIAPARWRESAHRRSQHGDVRRRITPDKLGGYALLANANPSESAPIVSAASFAIADLQTQLVAFHQCPARRRTAPYPFGWAMPRQFGTLQRYRGTRPKRVARMTASERDCTSSFPNTALTWNLTVFSDTPNSNATPLFAWP